jgi:hypothetical protein
MLVSSRVVLVAILCPFAAFAQESGRVTGVVVDQSGAAVPGAKVDLFLEGTGAAALSTVTTSAGVFNFAGVRAATYSLVVEAGGFSKSTTSGVVVNGARETAVPAIKLEVGSVTATVEVAAQGEQVQSTNAEISTTVTNEQVRMLPNINRSPQNLVLTQPGVTSGSGDAVINGMRPSFVNVTFDGINIQDNFIRTNDLTYSPNMLLLDQVAEITVSTSNAATSAGAGSSQVAFTSPSGANTIHGSAYWSNRNSALSANSWFNNQSGVPRAFLNQNQVGGRFGGAIVKNRLFYYGNYEAYRQHSNSSTNTTILTADARAGLFTYKDGAGNIQKVNVLTAAGVAADPTVAKLLALIPTPDKINNYNVGDSTAAFQRNTAGYSFLQRNNRIRDNALVRVDFNMSTRNVFAATYTWNRDNIDRGDVFTDYSLVPEVINGDHSHLLSLSWRWTPSGTLTNELKGGFDLAPIIFLQQAPIPSAIFTGTVFTNPVNTFRTQGRNVNSYNYYDTLNYVRGKHALQFGAQYFRSTIEAYNDAGITNSFGLAVGAGRTGLTNTQLPGISSSDLTAANSLLGTLAGFVDSYSQTFNVKSTTSGFVPNFTNLRHYIYGDFAFYAQDTWKIAPRLTVNLGLRWEYWLPFKDADGLQLFPNYGNNAIATILNPNATIDFASGSSGRPLYKSDKNNFAPNVSVAWDAFGNNKTIVRAGYNINYVDDELGTAIIGANNPGLAATASTSGLAGVTASNLPTVPTPAFKVPRTVADNWALSNSNSFRGIDPNLVTPYVQQYNIGIQRDFKGTIVELRYVGNHAVKQLRAFDYNQVNINANGFLADFLRAQSNGFLALAATRTFNPNYNSAIAGSQPLTVLPSMGNSGSLSLTGSTVTTALQQGNVAGLATTYQQQGLTGGVPLYTNTNALLASLLTNYSNSTYNSMQLDIRHRTRRGLTGQFNYVFSKVMSDAVGDSQGLSESFLDLHNAKLDRSRATFDLTHVFKGNVVYEVPLGPGHRLNYAPLGRVLGGWSMSGVMTYQSGIPFSITTGGRTTLSRVGSMASTSLTKSQLDDIVSFRMTGNGPYFVAASAIGSDGRGVAADGSAPFTGQVFFNPGAGTVGGLQQRMFSGPWDFNLDFGIQKTTKISERHSVELRMESSNIFNHPTFSSPQGSINSTTFGKITGTFFGRRVIQFGLFYRF